MTQAEKMLFGRFSREECGLPPTGADVFGDRLGVIRTLGLILALTGAAWLTGRMVANWREQWVTGLPNRIALAGDDAEQRSYLLGRGRMFATALPERPRLRRNLAYAALTAAQSAPRRSGYIGNAMTLLENASPEGENTLDIVAREMTYSGVLEETGDMRGALDALTRAGTALALVGDEQATRSVRLLLINAQAYYLATARESEGGDARRALELARLAVSSRDTLPGGGYASDSAAFVDTLAAARFANGLNTEASTAQTLALGMADSRELEVYVRHYDEFTAFSHR